MLIVLALLVALAFASLGALIGLRTGSGEAVQGVFPLFFVLVFLSSNALPRELIEQDWFRTIATCNPVSYLFEGLRSLVIFGWDAEALALGFGVAIAISLIGVLGAARRPCGRGWCGHEAPRRRAARASPGARSTASSPTRRSCCRR